jgi:dihydroorotate dehydrogenase subfamily 1
MAEIKGGFINTELWSELAPEIWIDKEYKIARKAGLPLIISLGYTPEQIAELASKVMPYADALELSTHYLGDNPTPVIETIKAAKEVVDVPVFIKISPHVHDLQKFAQQLERANADGIVAINTFGPCLAIDIETGNPYMGSQNGYGWLSGDAIRPLALRCVFDIARSVNIPVLGVGGITSGYDAIEFIMAGASAVQVCTAAIIKGATIFGKIASEITRFLAEHNYDSLDAIRGLAIRKVAERKVSTEPRVPTISPACTGCALCMRSCVYGAIKIHDGKAVIDAQKCFGCGLCVSRCKRTWVKAMYWE